MGSRVCSLFLSVLLVVSTLVVVACGPPRYTLTTSVSPSGAGIIEPAAGTYDAGTEVSIMATPASGYSFDHWSGDASGITSSVTLSMDSPKEVVAHFKAAYTLTTSISPSGAGIIEPAAGTYDAGTEVSIMATPASGYSFDHWSGDASGSQNPLAVNMSSNKNIVAYFELTQIEVELVQGWDEGLLGVTACGTDSLTRISLTITSKSVSLLKVVIMPGTVFESQSYGVQGMVVTSRREILVGPHTSVGPLDVASACVNMEANVPSESDSLILKLTPAVKDLLLLLNLADFNEESFRVRQFAIWTITDNPTRGGYVGIGYFGIGSGPDNEELERIRVLFQKAGISTDKYQALR